MNTSNILIYAADKPTGSSSGNTNAGLVLSSSRYSGTLEPHYLWGQLYDGFEDVDGDMKVNGKIDCDLINTVYINANEINTDKITSETSYSYYNYSDNAKIGYLETTLIKAKKGLIQDFQAKNITADYLTITKSAHFFELIIDQVKASGGAVIFSPANGFKVRKTEKLSDRWRLYFLAKEKDDEILNQWKKFDQAICQNFNQGKTVGTLQEVSSKYYWALVINTNNDDLQDGQPVLVNVGTSENTDNQYCHYIDISLTDYTGDLNPEPGDEICMLGSRGDDIDRQNAIYISSYKSLDEDLKAPLYVQYKNINSFDLSNKKYSWMSGGLTLAGSDKGLTANQLQGSLLTKDGKSVEDLINNSYSYFESIVKTSADENYSYMRNIYSYIDSLTGEVRQKVSWSYILQHANEITLEVYEDLNRTGIDITNGYIHLDANNTIISGNLNITDTDNGITVYETIETEKDNYKIPRVNIQPNKIQEIEMDLYSNGNKNINQNSETNQYYQGSTYLYYLGDNYSQEEDISLKEFDTIYLDMTNAMLWRATNSSTADTGTFATSCDIDFIIYDSQGNIYDKKENIRLSHEGYGRYTTKEITKFSCYNEGTYKIKAVYKLNGLNFSSNYPKIYGTVNWRIQIGSNIQTFIGTDGMYSHIGPNRLFYTGMNETRIQHGFGGIRFVNNSETELVQGNRNMQVSAGLIANGGQPKINWMPFYNFIPTFSPVFTQQQIWVNDRQETKYAFKIDPYNNCGICIVYSPAYGGDSYMDPQESWIVLPSETYTVDGKTVALPDGYCITIVKEFTNQNLYVCTAEKDRYIRDANLNMNRYYSMNDNMSTRDTFIKITQYAGGPSWISLHDT